MGCQKCVTGFDLAPLGCSFVLVDESAEDWPTFDAVAGEVSLPLVARIAGVDPGLAAALAAGLADTDVVHGTARLEFVHPVIRAAVYESLPSGGRASLHAAAAGGTGRYPPGGEAVHPGPGDPGSLAAAAQRLPPVPYHLGAEGVHRIAVAGHRVGGLVPAYYGGKPSSLFGDGQAPAPPDLGFHLGKLGPCPFRVGFPPDPEPPVLGRRADAREPQERERLRFPLPPRRPNSIFQRGGCVHATVRPVQIVVSPVLGVRWPGGGRRRPVCPSAPSLCTVGDNAATVRRHNAGADEELAGAIPRLRSERDVSSGVLESRRPDAGQRGPPA